MICEIIICGHIWIWHKHYNNNSAQCEMGIDLEKQLKVRFRLSDDSNSQNGSLKTSCLTVFLNCLHCEYCSILSAKLIWKNSMGSILKHKLTIRKSSIK